MQIEEFTVTFSSKNSSGKMGSTSIAPPAGIFFFRTKDEEASPVMTSDHVQRSRPRGPRKPKIPPRKSMHWSAPVSCCSLQATRGLAYRWRGRVGLAVPAVPLGQWPPWLLLRMDTAPAGQIALEMACNRLKDPAESKSSRRTRTFENQWAGAAWAHEPERSTNGWKQVSTALLVCKHPIKVKDLKVRKSENGKGKSLGYIQNLWQGNGTPSP